MTKNPFKLIRWLPTAESIHVKVVNNTWIQNGYLGCLKKKDWPKREEVLHYLATYTPDGKPHHPIRGEFVLAKYEGDWHRAKVTEADCQAILVYFVDCTFESTVHLNDIRAYPRGGVGPLYSDCYSVLCHLEDFGPSSGIETPLNKDQVDLLQNGVLSDGRKLIIDQVKEDVDLVTSIKCASVIKALKQ